MIYLDLLKTTCSILRLVKPRKSTILLAIACTGLASLFQLLGLGLIVPVLNGLVDEGSYEVLLKTSTLGRVLSMLPFEMNNATVFLSIVLAILFSVYMENVLVFSGQYLFSKSVTNINHWLRVAVFSRLVRFSKAFHDVQKPGELNAIIINVTNGVGQYFHTLGLIILTLGFCLTFFTMMMIISWRLTLMSIVVLPIIGLASRKLILKIRKSSHQEINKLLHLSDRALDRLLNIDLVQLSNAQQREIDALDTLSEQVRHHGFATRARSYFIPRVVDIINSTGIVVLGCVAVFLFTSVEASSIGRLSVFFISLRRLSSQVEQLTGYLGSLISGLPLLEKMLWVFDEKDKSYISGGELEFSGVKEKISFKGVRFSYGSTEVLKGIDLQIDAGKILAIVGPTGSGKSTLVKLFARFYDASAGEIEIDGTNIRQFSIESYRKRFALVEQSAAVVSGTMRENICYGIEKGSLTQAQIEEAAREANIHEFIVSLPQGYDTFVGGEGVRLSGGEAQRISIARAFLRNPEVLILDEPTSALDANTERLIQAAVKKISKGRTVFVVAHRLSTIMDADYVIVLKDGAIAEEGTVKELVQKKGTFYEYSELQNLFY